MDRAVSLPVVWTDDGAALHPGHLELDGRTLRLSGGTRGAERMHEIDVADIVSTRLARTGAERVGGRMTLVLELRRGGPIRIAGFERPGALRELADHLHVARG
jgi:hypothetical protein